MVEFDGDEVGLAVYVELELELGMESSELKSSMYITWASGDGPGGYQILRAMFYV